MHETTQIQEDGTMASIVEPRNRTAVGAFAVTVLAAALLAVAGPPAQAAEDILPTLTSFAVSTTSVDVTTGTARISVTMSVSDPDATGVGTGDVIAHGPKRGYNPGGQLVQVGGTATNTQYRADITLPAGKAVDYRLDISFMEADQFYLVDLQSQLIAAGWPDHVNAVVTAVPAAPRNVTFGRQIAAGKSIVVVSWAAPSDGQPVATGSVLTNISCGTLQSSSYASAWFANVPPSSVCSLTVSLANSAGNSPSVNVSARV
jgi:hypothetical protein